MKSLGLKFIDSYISYDPNWLFWVFTNDPDWHESFTMILENIL